MVTQVKRLTFCQVNCSSPLFLFLKFSSLFHCHFNSGHFTNQLSPFQLLLQSFSFQSKQWNHFFPGISIFNLNLIISLNSFHLGKNSWWWTRVLGIFNEFMETEYRSKNEKYLNELNKLKLKTENWVKISSGLDF